MPFRALVALCAVLFVVPSCGRVAEPTSVTRAAGTTTTPESHEPNAKSNPSEPTLFECPLESRVFGEAPPIPDIDRLEDIVDRVEQTTWDGFDVERVEATHLGVVALASGDLNEARKALREVGVPHVYRWDPSVASVGVDAAGQVRQVLQWLIEPAVHDLRASYRGIRGYETLALWQEAGAVLLQWKAPVPTEIKALEGVRPDGVRVIVKPTRFSERDWRAASAKVNHAIRDGRVDANWSTMGGCADGSGLVVGIEPASLGDRRSALQAQLSEVANIPVYVMPEEAPITLPR